MFDDVADPALRQAILKLVEGRCDDAEIEEIWELTSTPVPSLVKEDAQALVRRLLDCAGGDGGFSNRTALELAVAYSGMDADLLAQVADRAADLVSDDPHRVGAWIAQIDSLRKTRGPAVAARVAETALTHNPRHTELLMILVEQAVALERDGDRDRAVELAAAALRDDLDDPLSAYEAAGVLAYNGRAATVAEFVERMSHKRSGLWLPLIRGLLAASTGDYENGLAEYERVWQARNHADEIAEDVADTAALAGGELLRTMGRLAEAEDALKDLPEVASIQFLRAAVAVDRDMPTKALGILEPILAEVQSDAEALQWLAIALRARRSLDRADRVLNNPELTGAARVTAEIERARLAHDRGHYAEAELTFRLLESREPVLSAVGRSAALRAMGKLDEARQIVEPALQTWPDDVFLRQEVAYLRYDAGDYFGAAADFGELVQRNRYDYESRRWQAISLRAQKKYEEAWDVLAAAPPKQDHSSLKIERAWHMYDQGDFGPAEDLFRGVLTDDSNPIEAVWGLSAALRSQGRSTAAAEYVRKALQERPGDPTLDRELAWIAYDEARYENARDTFRALVARDPFNVTDRRWLATCHRATGHVLEADDVLAAAPQRHRDLDIDRAYLALARHEPDTAHRHVRAAIGNNAPVHEYLPLLVEALLKSGRDDTAEREVAKEVARTEAPAVTVAAARADIHMFRVELSAAIEELEGIAARADEATMLRLVGLLRRTRSTKDARAALDGWLRTSVGGSDLRRRSPSLVAADLELACDDATDESRRAKVEDVLNRYAGEAVPTTVLSASISILLGIDLDRVEQLVEVARTRRPYDLDVWFEAARVLATRGDHIRACAEFEEILRRNGHHERAAQWHCRMLRRLGRWSELQSRLHRRDHDFPHSARMAVEHGWLLVLERKLPEAVECFAAAVKNDPEYRPGFVGLVHLFALQQRWSEAKAVVTRWRALWPRSDRIVLAEAMLLMEQERYREARELLRNREDLPARLGFAYALDRMGESSIAREQLSALLEKHHDRPGPRLALATLLLRGDDEGSWTTAEENCLQSTGHGAEADAVALICRAQLALKRNHLRAAEAMLREACTRNPFSGYRIGLAEVLRRQYRLDEARQLLEPAVRSYPDDADLRSQLFLAYRELGLHDEAIDALRAAVALRPADNRLLVQLAYELHDHGRSAEAESSLRRWLGASPAGSDASVQLGLAHILLLRAEDLDSADLYEEAEELARQALTQKQGKAERDRALRLRGIALMRLGALERAPSERARLISLAQKCLRKAPRPGQGHAPFGRFFLSTGSVLDWLLRFVVSALGVVLIAILWFKHDQDPEKWTMTAVLTLTPVLLATSVLAALLPALQTFKLAGLEAQTKERAPEPLPRVEVVKLPEITTFAMTAFENFYGVINVELASGAAPASSSNPSSPEASRVKPIRSSPSSSR